MQAHGRACCSAFWDGLDEEQRSALYRAAFEAGVNLSHGRASSGQTA